MTMEFGINTVSPVTNREALITGRCFYGKISVGARFRRAFVVILSPDESTSERRLIANVDLRITKIEAYGKELDELDEGLTAAITVCGDGVSLLSPRMSIDSLVV